MALDKRIMEMVEAAKHSGEELNKMMAERRERRNNAIRAYQPENLDDIDAVDIARDEMEFIQRIEAYDGHDVSRFAEIVGTYLARAPAGDQKRFTNNLMRLHDAVANGAAWCNVSDDLDSLT
ncbi:hypothetical protein [Devosia sp. 919]|uniref:hypothetical protein n=1 Tax=Devosia sp. 919 TaxID=2726065 RepID=UPI00155669FD|nr:hypothetical protein [Devosia sp. 919]